MDALTVDRGRHLITRGNLDGLACAAVFLSRFPRSTVSFVTSPPAALKELERVQGRGKTILADIPLTEALAVAIEERGAFLVDHHPTTLTSKFALIDPEQSAAGVLHGFLGRPPASARAAALADLYERSGSVLLSATVEKDGLDRLEAEASVLDLAWRFNVEDDGFRRDAAVELSRGRWPSEAPLINERFRAVREGGRWERALERVRGCLEVRGTMGLLDLRRKRLSLAGFGSAALSAAARERGCQYALLLHGSKDTATASIRSTRRDCVDLGRFVGAFTREHGLDGGGHRASAGARVPLGAADALIDELAAVIA